MKVKVVRNVKGHKTGDIIDVEEDIAVSLLASGDAEEVKKDTKKDENKEKGKDK